MKYDKLNITDIAGFFVEMYKTSAMKPTRKNVLPTITATFGGIFGAASDPYSSNAMLITAAAFLLEKIRSSPEFTLELKLS